MWTVWTTVPLYYRLVYRSLEGRIGLLLGLNAGLIVTVEMVLVRFAERYRPVRVCALGAFLLCAGFALMPLGSTFSWAAVTVMVWTFGEMLAVPFVTALVARRAGPGNVGRYMGIYSLAFSLAAAVAPAAGAGAWELWGPNAPWLATAVLGVLLAAGFLALEPALGWGEERRDDDLRG